ncbi:lipopolysaccharide biosynthesis protein [Haliea sp.]
MSIGRSLTISIAQRYLTIGLQLLSFVIIARLLTPEEIGLYSVAVAVIGIAQILRDFGIGSYLIQERELTDERIRTAFTVTLIVSMTLFLIVLGCAKPAASFYDDERLTGILGLLSINFLLIPFNSTTLSLLKRDMRFGLLAIFSILASVAGTASAIGFAFAGAGYNALVYSSIISTVTLVLAGAVYRRSEFVLRPTLVEWRRITGFGSQVAFTNVLGHIAINMNDLVVGKALGFTAVGILSRAQGVMNLFHRDMMGAIKGVAYPAFAEASRRNADMEDIHNRSITALTAVAWPFYGFFALYPLESLRFLFGPQWDAAAPLVPVFCAAGAVAAIWSLAMNMTTAMGRVKLATLSALINQSVRIIVLVLVAATFDDIMPFAIALFGVYCFQLVTIYTIKQLACPTRWRTLGVGLMNSAALTILSLAPSYAVYRFILTAGSGIDAMFAVPLLAVCVAVSWVTTIRLIKHPTLYDEMLPAHVKRILLYPWRPDKGMH